MLSFRPKMRSAICAVIAVVGVAGIGCGAQTTKPGMLTVSLSCERSGEAIELEDGLAELGDHTQAWTMSLRVGAIDAALAEGEHQSLLSTAVNVDLLRRTVLIEESVPSSHLSGLRVSVPQPPGGSGVVSNRGIAIFVAGLMDETPFEYSAVSLQDFVLPLEQSIGDHTEIDLVLHVDDWFDDIEPELLDIETNPDTGIETLLLDEAHNQEAAASIGRAISGSLATACVCGDSDCGSCEHEHED